MGNPDNHAAPRPGLQPDGADDADLEWAADEPDPWDADPWDAEAGDLEWTYLSPAPEIHAGARTGTYRTTRDQLLADAQGKSTITFEDYAVALLDELERPRHLRLRFGVAY